MKKPARSKVRKAMKPQPVAASALPQVRGGVDAENESDPLDEFWKNGTQHNETLVRDR